MQDIEYVCRYGIGAMRDGAPVQYDGGVWIVRATKKQVIFNQTIPPFFRTPWTKLACRLDNHSKHCLTVHSDGTYTVYPDRAGIPYTFTPKVSEPSSAA
jgi:hypothetical protein